jgi:hypothetical protein
VAMHQRMNWIEYVLGNYSAALALADKGIALAQGDVKLGAHILGYSPTLYSMVIRIVLLAYLGRREPWVTACEQVEQLALERDEIEIVACAALIRCEARILYGDPTVACRDGARATEICEQLGSPFGIALAALQGKNPLLEIILLARLSEARAGTGDIHGACDSARDALALCRRFPEMRDSGVRAAYKIAGVLLRAEGVSPDAVEAVELAERLTRDTGFRALEPEALRVRAELERLRGDEAAHRRALEEAHRILVEIGATARAARVAQGMSR